MFKQKIVFIYIMTSPKNLLHKIEPFYKKIFPRETFSGNTAVIGNVFKKIYPILSVKYGRNNWVAKEHWQEAAYRTAITEKRVIACGECEKLLEQIKRSCHRKTGSNKAKQIRVYDENRI